jgi:hypothetical protein
VGTVFAKRLMRSTRLPPPDPVAAARKTITRAIETTPTAKKRKLLIGLMLNDLGVRASDDTDGHHSSGGRYPSDGPSLASAIILARSAKS